MFKGTANSEQLTMLSKVLEDYCRDAGIQRSGLAYESVALRVMSLYTSGVDDADGIRKALRVNRD